LGGEATAPLVRILGVTKSFGPVKAVDHVSFDIAPGEFFALLGPSGCGKTTLMRLIAGFEQPDGGSIRIGGRDMGGVPSHRRPVNMVFQSYALFPHLTVERNIAFGLEQDRVPRHEIGERVLEMLKLVQLEGLGTRRPDQLSGGQRQRVALARALAKRPSLILLDEPLAALDRKLREETQFELMRVQRELGTAFLIVTHDQEEAMVMANRIAVMRAGKIEQIGTPREIYDLPRSRWVAGFVGDINIFDAKVEAAYDVAKSLKDVVGGVCHLRLAEGAMPHQVACDEHLTPGQNVALAVRPEKVVLAPASSDGPGLIGTVQDVAFRGETVVYRVAFLSGQIIRASRVNQPGTGAELVRGDAVRVSFHAAAGRVLVR
jgi:putrescine transport system ATP-binding protein